jgi:hypothetical protein
VLGRLGLSLMVRRTNLNPSLTVFADGRFPFDLCCLSDLFFIKGKEAYFTWRWTPIQNEAGKCCRSNILRLAPLH